MQIQPIITRFLCILIYVILWHNFIVFIIHQSTCPFCMHWNFIFSEGLTACLKYILFGICMHGYAIMHADLIINIIKNYFWIAKCLEVAFRSDMKDIKLHADLIFGSAHFQLMHCVSNFESFSPCVSAREIEVRQTCACMQKLSWRRVPMHFHILFIPEWANAHYSASSAHYSDIPPCDRQVTFYTSVNLHHWLIFSNLSEIETWLK